MTRCSRRAALLGAGVVTCAALLAGGVSPVWAAGDGDGAVAEPGGFSVGDGLEAMIGETDGSVRFAVTAGGLDLHWDSRSAAVDRIGFGDGWGLGLTTIDTEGGVRVFPASGGVFEVDASAPSGLAGYTRGDAVFRVAEQGAALPARSGRAEAAYAYVLHELGGTRTFFNEAGNPVAHLGPADARIDWIWAGDTSPRLTAVIDADGVITEIDWSDPAELVVRPGANAVEAAPGSGAGGEWRLGIERGRLTRVSDPLATTTRIDYDAAGLMSMLSAPSGTSTTMAWHAATDGVARVATARTLDTSGAELSRREWTVPRGAVSAWPAVDASSAAPRGGAAQVSRPPYTTSLSDGTTRVESTIGSRGVMTQRSVIIETRSGDVVAHEQKFSFDAADPAWPVLQPTTVAVTYRDARGASRALSESFEYDAFGRLVRRVAADGSVTDRVYDEQMPGGIANAGEADPGAGAPPDRPLLPVGALLAESVTAPDGSFEETRFDLDPDRVLPVSAVTVRREPGGADEVVARSEFTVVDGVVVEERAYPHGDAAATPVITTRSHDLDLAAGTRRVVETVAAGTAASATQSVVTSLVHGGALSETNAVGGRSLTSYDAAGRPVSSIDPAGRRTDIAYRMGDGGSSVTTTGPDGVAVTEERDALGRTKRLFDDVAPTGRVAAGTQRVFERREYPAPGVVEVFDAWGARTRTEHDVFSRPVRVTLPTGAMQISEYDDVAGTVTAGTSVTGGLEEAVQTRTQHVDVLGRVTSTTGERADGIEVPGTKVGFDGFGREVATNNGVTDTRVEYDAAGDPVVSTTGPAAGRAGAELVAERRFDGFGRSVEKTLSAGDESRTGGSREFDELGRTIAESDRSGVRETYSYSPDGLVERVASDTGQETVNTYDDTTRELLETRIRFPGRVDVATGYAYDDATGRLIAVFDPADRARTEITYSYDDLGNLRETRYPADGPGAPRPRLTNEYDANGRRTASVDVLGNRTAYAYDDAGALAEVEQRDASGDVVLARVRYGSDELGRVTTVERGNGVVTELDYTSAHQVASETTTRDGRLHSTRTYEYDPASGNLTARVDRVAHDDGQVAAERIEYAYDALNRLTGSIERSGAEADASVRQTTAYDLAVSGDVLAETVTTDPGTADEAVTTRRFSYSPVGELEAIATTAPDGTEHLATQEYDETGNLVRGADGTVYAWDAADRQISQTTVDGVHTGTSYWADGSRSALTTDQSGTTFYWDGSVLANERHRTDAGGRVSAEPAATVTGDVSYLIGLTRHARTVHPESGQDETTSYYGTDRHGNVTGLTDAAGTVTARYRYSDYGVASSPADGLGAAGVPGGRVGDASSNPYGYASEYTHDDGSQFLTWRVYDARLMDFRSRDSKALHNVYGYANANPIMLVDPSGRDAVVDAVALGLAAWGVLSALSGAYVALAAFAGLIAGAAGGPALVALGAAAAVVATGNAAFTGLEAWSVATDIRFMPDEVALGVGVGLAVTGSLLGYSIVKTARYYGRVNAAASGSVETKEVGAAVPRTIETTVVGQPSTTVVHKTRTRAQLKTAFEAHLGGKPLTVGDVTAAQGTPVSTTLMDRIGRVHLGAPTGHRGEVNRLRKRYAYDKSGSPIKGTEGLRKQLDTAEGELIVARSHLMSFENGSQAGLRELTNPFMLVDTTAESLNTLLDNAQGALKRAIDSLTMAQNSSKGVVLPGFQQLIDDINVTHDAIQSLARY